MQRHSGCPTLAVVKMTAKGGATRTRGAVSKQKTKGAQATIKLASKLQKEAQPAGTLQEGWV